MYSDAYILAFELNRELRLGLGLGLGFRFGRIYLYVRVRVRVRDSHSKRVPRRVGNTEKGGRRGAALNENTYRHI